MGILILNLEIRWDSLLRHSQSFSIVALIVTLFFSPSTFSHHARESFFRIDWLSTMVTIDASTTVKVKKKPIASAKSKAKAKSKPGAKRGAAPPLRPKTLATAAAVEALKQLDDEGRRERVAHLLRAALGEATRLDKSAPHAASTTKDRAAAAADLAVATKELGVVFVFKKCSVTASLQRMLFPGGLETLFTRSASQGGLRPSASAVSLASMDDTTVTSLNSGGTDGKRGKTTPPNGREGSLLLIRALCEKLGKVAEPFLVSGFLAAALDECGSSASSVREAAEDTATALINIANPWAFPALISPMLVQSMSSTEWRVKYNALDRLAQCAATAPDQVNYILPKLIPEVTSQVWDTKAQVTKAASHALLAICKTCKNPDVLPAIPAVVNAISKPAETNKAVQELMSTTFVASVDAPTLSILCPVLARALKEKLAINKRAACIVIKNMSRLVESPTAVAPFGPLLVPELKKVANNVQFEEIRDEALSALNNLTKALGDSYKEDGGVSSKEEMDRENERVEAEQKRIEEERAEELRKEEEIRKKEADERAKFKEAMEAQRALDKIAAEEAEKKKVADMKKKDKAMRSTKGAGGKCQSCGLKKCKKTCVFANQ